MLANLAEIRAQAAQAKREWEELDPAHTSFEMRKRAETRYLTLRALLRSLEPVPEAPTRVQRAEKWRVQAERAASC